MKVREQKVIAKLKPLKDYVVPNDNIKDDDLIICQMSGPGRGGWVAIDPELIWLYEVFNEFEAGDEIEIIVRKRKI